MAAGSYSTQQTGGAPYNLNEIGSLLFPNRLLVPISLRGKLHCCGILGLHWFLGLPLSLHMLSGCRSLCCALNTTEVLYMPFLLPGMLFLQISAWLHLWVSLFTCHLPSTVPPHRFPTVLSSALSPDSTYVISALGRCLLGQWKLHEKTSCLSVLFSPPSPVPGTGAAHGRCSTDIHGKDERKNCTPSSLVVLKAFRGRETEGF